MPLKHFWNFIIDFCACVLSHVGLFVTPWTVARQAPLSLGIQSNVEIYNTICKTDSQWNLLYDSGNSNRGSVTGWRVGWGVKSEGGPEGGAMDVPVADSCWYMTENHKIL